MFSSTKDLYINLLKIMNGSEEPIIKKIDSHKDLAKEQSTEKKKAKSPQEKLTPRGSIIDPIINHDKQKCNCSNVHHDQAINCEICNSLKKVCPTITKDNCVKCYSKQKKISHSMILENRPCTRIELPSRFPRHLDAHPHVIAHSIQNKPKVSQHRLMQKPIIAQSKPLYKPIVTQCRQCRPIVSQVPPVIAQNRHVAPKTIHQPQRTSRRHSIPSVRFTYESSPHKDSINHLRKSHIFDHHTNMNPESHKKQHQLLDELIHQQMKNQLSSSKKDRAVLFRHYNKASPLTRNSLLVNSSKA